MDKIYSRGAEAKIILLENNCLCKQREEKPYRNKLLDNKLRKFRTKREVKVLKTLFESGCNVPEVFSTDYPNFNFTFEFLNGEVLKKVLNEKLLFEAFDQIIKMHKQEIVHGDLTTLNMIVLSNKVYIIDFGLSSFSTDIEQRAVDLHLFFTCISNQHFEFIKFKKKLLEKYKNNLGEEIINRLDKIEKRGRNKNK